MRPPNGEEAPAPHEDLSESVATKQADTAQSSVWPSFGLPNAPLVKAWAADFYDLPYVPTAGSAEWAALDDYDPAKLAAVVRAGVAWVTETAQLPQRLAEQLDAENRDLAERFKAASIDVFVGTDWGHVTEHNRWLAANPWAKRVAS